jgi:hypothetical protein
MTREQIQAAVKAVLKEGIWPIYSSEDDRGLEEDEYVEFVTDVIRRLPCQP